MDKLHDFYRDKEMRETVHNSLMNYAKDLAGNKAMQGVDVKGFEHVTDSINSYFTALKNQYEPEKEKKEPESSE